MHPSVSAELRKRVKRVVMMFEGDMEESNGPQPTNGRDMFAMFIEDYLMTIDLDTWLELTDKPMYNEDVVSL